MLTYALSVSCLDGCVCGSLCRLQDDPGSQLLRCPVAPCAATAAVLCWPVWCLGQCLYSFSCTSAAASG